MKATPTKEHLDAITNLSKNIKNERSKQNLSQSGLSAASGIEKGSICKMENLEYTNPTIGTLSKLAKGLNTSIVSLISAAMFLIQNCKLDL